MKEKWMEDLDQILAQLFPEEIERGIQSLKQALLDLDRQDQEMMQRVVPKESSWQTFMEGLYGFTSDVFEDGRDQGIQEDRENL